MADDLDELNSKLMENATGPRSVSGDQGTVQQHSLPDQIAADRYLRSKDAVKKGRGLGLRFCKLLPPGAD